MRKSAWGALLSVCVLGTAIAGIPAFTALPVIEYEVGDEARVQSIALGDVDLDGVADMVAANDFLEEVYLFTGAGDGSFAEPTLIGEADLPTAVAIADLTSPFASATAGDVDGNPDVVVVDEIGQLQIFIGLGDGTFDPPDQSFDDLDTFEITGVGVADFDGDGRDDLALLDGIDGVYFLCNERGTLQPCPTSLVLLEDFDTFELVDIAVGDFNGGGLDVAVVDIATSELYPIFGNGDGTFDEVVVPLLLGDGVEPRALRSALLDEDALDELVVLSYDPDADESTVVVLNGSEGSTSFVRTDYPAGGVGNALALADYDGDQAIDAVVVGQDEFETTGDSAFLAGDGAGGFAAPIGAGLDTVAGGRVLQSADLDGDARPDLVAAITEGTQIQVLLTGEPVAATCAGDCNGDGMVGINELVLAVNIALGTADIAACTAADGDHDEMVSINELIRAVNNALLGCPA